MLAQDIPAFDHNGPISQEEVYEAFMLCYLASYSGQTIQTRPLESYRRAFGFDNLIFAGAPDLHTPGFLLATFPNLQTKQLVVAVAGLSDLRQILFRVGGQSVYTESGIPGHFWQAPGIIANSIFERLAAIPYYAATLAHGGVGVTFTGYSLGAAVAELMAAKYKRDNPNRQVKLLKFASPRIGNRAYLNGYNPRIEKYSVFIEGDPINRLPNSLQNNSLYAFTGMVMCYLQTDDEASVLNAISAEPAGFSSRTDWRDTMYYALQATRTLNPQNAWWRHRMDSYRYTLQLSAQKRSDRGFLRMAALEHNDENNWQVRWSAATSDTTPTHHILDPVPENLPVPLQFQANGNDFGGGGEEGNDFGGGGEEEVVRTAPGGGNSIPYTRPELVRAAPRGRVVRRAR